MDEFEKLRQLLVKIQEAMLKALREHNVAKARVCGAEATDIVARMREVAGAGAEEDEEGA